MDMKGCAVVVIACKLAQESEESVVKKHDSHDGHDRTNWDRQHPPPGTKHPTRYKKHLHRLVILVTRRQRRNELSDLMMALGKKHVLAVFDFDHTLINLNTDGEVQKLSPGGRLPEERFGTLQETLNWQEFMQQVFNHLHENLVCRAQYIH